MKKIIVCLFSIFLTSAILIPIKTLARENITDWYIKDFSSEIVLNTDSSLTITESIIADCGNLTDKHGIFRVLPEFYYGKDNQKIPAKIHLNSIKDNFGNNLQYSTIKNRVDDTITWKIGDPNKTVTGENQYEIKYVVSNAVRHGEKDELYWNLNGNFWDIETDKFDANVLFPEGINSNNSEVNVYTGSYGEKDSGLANYVWRNNGIEISSNTTLQSSEGVTLSVSFPDGIINPYVPTLWEKYGFYLYYLIPITVLIFCFMLWRKFGKDPKDNPTVSPEFEVPDDLSPMEMGVIYSDGIMKTNYMSAAIIQLAVKGHLKIEEIPKQGAFSTKDYNFIANRGKQTHSYDERLLLDKLFKGQESVFLSTLKNNFFSDYNSITKTVNSSLAKNKILFAYSRQNQAIFAVLGIVAIFISFFLNSYGTAQGNSALFSGLILVLFSFFMRKRTVKGLKIFRRIQGFKLYMDMAEKYRSKFNEKENIFEKFLPYAIMFGMTKEWINKIKDIYGEKYFTNYHPVWFYGYAFANFDVNTLNSAISDMSKNMASTMASNPSSSGAGGGGFSGGGGGGGGGGGW